MFLNYFYVFFCISEAILFHALSDLLLIQLPYAEIPLKRFAIPIPQ